MTQLALTLPGITVPTYEPTMTLAEKFAAFHAANPHVADALERLAEQWFAAGNAKCSTKLLMERARWEFGISGTGDDYRLNNNWTAFYARLLIARRPEWADAFALRTQPSEAA